MGLGIGPRLIMLGHLREYQPQQQRSLERTSRTAKSLAILLQQLKQGWHERRDHRTDFVRRKSRIQGQLLPLRCSSARDWLNSHVWTLNAHLVQNSIKLQAEEGFDALIDSMTDCAEYAEVFGSDIVPYTTAENHAGCTPPPHLSRSSGAPRWLSVIIRQVRDPLGDSCRGLLNL